MVVVDNVEVQFLSIYFKVHIKVKGVMFFVVVEGLCMLMIGYMLKSTKGPLVPYNHRFS